MSWALAAFPAVVRSATVPQSVWTAERGGEVSSFGLLVIVDDHTIMTLVPGRMNENIIKKTLAESMRKIEGVRKKVRWG